MNASSIGSSVGSILGWGIGLGLLAHTAKNVARTTDEMYQPARKRRPVRMKRRGNVRTRPSPRMHRTTRMRTNRPRLNIPNYYSKW
ncbi:MAG: hypothetical protein ACOC1X_01665 [Promethearchaeota archaeon]